MMVPTISTARPLRLVVLLAAVPVACAPHPAATPGATPRNTATSADGVSIRYDVRGSGDPALVLIHGGLCHSGFWSAQVSALSRDFQVITLDLAGHGRAGRDRPAWTLDAFAEDVRAVVEVAGPQRVVLVGSSMGGPVALRAARLMPERVIGVVGVDTLHDAARPPDPDGGTARVAAFRDDFAAAREAMVQQCFHEDADPRLVALVRREMAMVAPEVAVAVLEIFTSYDMAGELRRSRVPVRALNGDLVPTNVEGNRAVAPGYEALIMTGIGHFPMLERPEPFNRHLARQARGLAIRHELLAMRETDQAIRHEMAGKHASGDALDPADAARWQSIDVANTARLEAIVAEHGWPGRSWVGDDGARAAWLLIQHADHDRPFQKRGLALLEDAVAQGEASPTDLAYLTDRVRVAEGKPQVYGTQVRWVDGEPAPFPLEDEANVDRRRAAVGLGTLAEYLEAMKGR